MDRWLRGYDTGVFSADTEGVWRRQAFSTARRRKGRVPTGTSVSPTG